MSPGGRGSSHRGRGPRSAWGAAERGGPQGLGHSEPELRHCSGSPWARGDRYRPGSVWPRATATPCRGRAHRRVLADLPEPYRGRRPPATPAWPGPPLLVNFASCITSADAQPQLAPPCGTGSPPGTLSPACPAQQAGRAAALRLHRASRSVKRPSPHRRPRLSAPTAPHPSTRCPRRRCIRCGGREFRRHRVLGQERPCTRGNARARFPSAGACPSSSSPSAGQVIPGLGARSWCPPNRSHSPAASRTPLPRSQGSVPGSLVVTVMHSPAILGRSRWWRSRPTGMAISASGARVDRGGVGVDHAPGDLRRPGFPRVDRRPMSSTTPGRSP